MKNLSDDESSDKSTLPLDYAQAAGASPPAQAFLTRDQRKLGRNVLLFSLVGWTLPIAAAVLSRGYGAMIVVSTVILVGFFTMQHSWGPSAAGKIGMWIIAAWSSLLLLYSMVLAPHVR